MKIEELISGKGDNDQIEIEAISIPVCTLKNFVTEGFTNRKSDQPSNTVTFWETSCCACLMEE